MSAESIFGFTRTDKIGIICLFIGGIGFLYNYSGTLVHFLNGDFKHLDQPALLSPFLSIVILITCTLGTFLTMRWLMTTEDCF